MNSKKFIKSFLCILITLLLITSLIQIIIDPLFQYHTPWFGMQPVIKNERYQNAGIAKNFEFDNAIIGNSLAQNFRASDISKAFGGKTVKLTAAGSHTLDWTYLLNILSKRKNAPNNIILNIDPYILLASYTSLKHPLPKYLYDTNYLNDINYLLNFEIFSDFTYISTVANIKNSVPEYDDFVLWNKDFEYGKDFVVKNYKKLNPDLEIAVAKKTVGDVDTEIVSKNLSLITPYIKKMKNTKFVFFFSPISMLFWHIKIGEKNVENMRQYYLRACEILTVYDNVTVYFWTDDEILKIMGDLDNYVDEAHYSPEICKILANRMEQKTGVIKRDTYEGDIDRFFDYVYGYDYSKLF